tara:strand:- start:2095 stop:2481 length:387 start_codon:yes stop_codon:yes gene_type:complete
MITRKYLTEATPSEKDEMRKLYREHSVIKEQFDFSIEGIKNIVPYWAEKLGYDADDIDVSVEGIKNIPDWWSDELTKVVEAEVKEKGDKMEPEELMNSMYNTMKSVYDKLPSRSQVTDVIKSVFCPFC